MPIVLEKLDIEHQDAVIEIFNHYIRTVTAAFREHVVEKDYFQNFLQLGETHPVYAIKAEGDNVIGFCMLKPHIPLSTFAEAAELMYFIDHEYTGRGIGSLVLQRLEEDARKMGVKNLLASISSENTGSINFHRKHGFAECGRFKNIGKKLGRTFSVVWMEKEIA